MCCSRNRPRSSSAPRSCGGNTARSVQRSASCSRKRSGQRVAEDPLAERGPFCHVRAEEARGLPAGDADVAIGAGQQIGGCGGRARLLTPVATCGRSSAGCRPGRSRRGSSGSPAASGCVRRREALRPLGVRSVQALVNDRRVGGGFGVGCISGVLVDVGKVGSSCHTLMLHVLIRSLSRSKG